MSDTQKLPKSDLCFYCSHPVDLANRGSVALGDKVAHLQCALEPRDTQNQWVSVNERLPETARSTLVLMVNEAQRVGFYDNGNWYLERSVHLLPVRSPLAVTHWMDLPEPPAPPKPADPFEAWYAANNYDLWNKNNLYAAWNAAKAHYERPLPDFEAWWKRQLSCGTIVTIRYHNAKDIWNAAQGRTDG